MHLVKDVRWLVYTKKIRCQEFSIETCKAGLIQPGDVYKVCFPRSDLKIKVAEVELKSTFALGSWVTFKKAGDMTMVMGDQVLI